MAPPSGLAPESWEDLFDFLDPGRRDASGPDRDREAEARCADVMRRLICFFAGRRCADAEDLAMETVLRVAAKCREVDVSSHVDRIGYFYGVARNVVHEAQRSARRESNVREAFKHQIARLAAPDPNVWRHKEAVQSCLERCLAKLPGVARRLIVRYHAHEGREKVASHQALAAELGKSVNALRIEVYRIRRTLQRCVFDCLHPAAY